MNHLPASRRQFLRAAAFAGAMGAASGFGLSASQRGDSGGGPADEPAGAGEPEGSNQPLDLLILGGTGFLGPHIVEAAVARGHTMTLFNRGRTNTHLFPDLEKLRGDRDPDKGDGLTALEGRKWDAVIDTSAYVPRIAEASAALLADSVRQYVFVSTVSVYASHAEPGMDERAAVGQLEDRTIEQVTGATYGPLKALCEEAIEETMPGRVTTIRPGLIVGPLDSTDRFTYWPVRVDRGGEILCPGTPADPLQYIDARDLAAWIVHTIEQGITGLFNAVGPDPGYTLGELLTTCRAVSGNGAELTWVPADFLTEHEVAPWSDMPAWVPTEGEMAGFGSVSNERARRAGLTFRPTRETVADTLAWFETLPDERRAGLRAGIAPEREAEVLAAWHAREGEVQGG